LKIGKGVVDVPVSLQNGKNTRPHPMQGWSLEHSVIYMPP